MMGTLGDTYTIWRKDMLTWLKEPLYGFVRLMIMPLILMIVFGNAVGGGLTNIPIAVVNYDGSASSAGFLTAMTAENVVRVTYAGSYEHALELFRSRQVQGVVIIPENFIGMGRVDLLVDYSSPQSGSSIDMSVSRAAASFSNPPVIGVRKDVHYAHGASYLDFLAPGIVIQTIAFAALFSGGLNFLLERQLGALTMVLVAPVKKEAIVLGKTLASVTQAVLGGIMALIIGFGLGVKVELSIAGMAALFVIMALTGFCFIGLSVAISSRVNDLPALMMLINLIVMPLWIASGSLYPVEAMPWWLRCVSVVDPLTYATDAARSTLLRGFDPMSIMFDVLALAGFAVAMFGFGVMSFRRHVA